MRNVSPRARLPARLAAARAARGRAQVADHARHGPHRLRLPPLPHLARRADAAAAAQTAMAEAAITADTAPPPASLAATLSWSYAAPPALLGHLRRLFCPTLRLSLHFQGAAVRLVQRQRLDRRAAQLPRCRPPRALQVAEAVPSAALALIQAVPIVVSVQNRRAPCAARRRCGRALVSAL